MVDMSTLKELRAITHAPLKDCKSALEDANGDLVKAQDILREKGALKAASKADRATNEGIVMIQKIGNKTIGLKLACETDFVAKNDTFRSLAAQIVTELNKLDVVDSWTQIDTAVQEKLNTILKDNFVTIGENMKILDAFVKEGNTYVYTHPGDKVASVIFYTGDEDKAKAVALQVAAMSPQYLTIDDVPTSEKEQLQAQFAQELQDSGKPTDIIEKIIMGKLQKVWNEMVLLEQTSIVDDSKKVKDLLGDTVVHSYIRLAI